MELIKELSELKIELGYRDAMVILAPMIIDLMKGNSIERVIRKNNSKNKI